MPNLSLKAKILFISTLPLILFSMLLVYSIVNLNKSKRNIEMISNRFFPQIKHAKNAELGLVSSLRFLNLAILDIKSARDAGPNLAESKVHYVYLNDELKKFSQVEMSSTLREKLDPLLNQVHDFDKKYENILEQLASSSVDEQNKAISFLADKEFAKTRADIVKDLEEISNYVDGRVASVTEEAELESSQSVRNIVILSVVLFLSSCFLMIFQISAVSRSVFSTSESLFVSASEMTKAISQLSSSATELSSSTTESSSSLQESVSSLQELNSMVKLNSESAVRAAEVSEKCKVQAQLGSEELQALNKSMGEIFNVSKKMEEIVQVIDDIAFQTNLLALNAAVEAARAGEQGKGFAVVAEAVRSLAQRSSQSAKEVSELIKKNSEVIKSGSSVAQSSGQVLNSIVEGVISISQLNNEIANGSKEQANGIDQISTAFNQLDASVQSNASLSELIASSSEEMASQVQQLESLTGSLKLLVTGQKS